MHGEERWMKGRRDLSRRESFTLSSAVFRRQCVLAQAERAPSSRGLEEGEKLNFSLVNKHYILIDQQKQAIWLILYEINKVHFKGPSLSLQQVNKGIFLSLFKSREEEVSLQEALFLDTRLDRFLHLFSRITEYRLNPTCQWSTTCKTCLSLKLHNSLPSIHHS